MSRTFEEIDTEELVALVAEAISQKLQNGQKFTFYELTHSIRKNSPTSMIRHKDVRTVARAVTDQLVAQEMISQEFENVGGHTARVFTPLLDNALPVTSAA